MIRKIATYALIGAFSLATTPGFACTGISLNAKDGTMIRGRTMEFGFPLSSNVIVVPAGTALDRHAARWQARASPSPPNIPWSAPMPSARP